MDDRKQKLDEIKKDLDKRFGKGTLMLMGQASENIQTFPSGSLSLDLILGGGYPKGRIIEIYGPESAGKSTLALQAVAQIQKAGEIAAYIDAEHSLDPVYANKIGVNCSQLWISQPDSGEQALNILEALVKTRAVGLIVVDSVAALTPQAELDGEMGESHMGLQARLMSQALRKVTALMAKSNTTVIFINQIRMKIGTPYGNPETTCGGNALKFYSSVRLDVRKGELIKKNDEVIGAKMRIKCVKNKIAPPFGRIETDLYFDRGICKHSELCDVGLASGVVKRNGAWYSFSDLKCAGRDAFISAISQNPELAQQLEEQIWAM